jgi:hypothetical protein
MYRDKPYTDWCTAYAKCKNKDSKLDLYERTFKGEFGPQVKFSLFGMWDYSDPELVDELIDSETISNMKFYARLE